ncbi:MAG: hypothetical protein LUM44_00830 [Pyrinomonadaceae bacterium]|nr:hypothetical protein [Pyrinomonadaceae bacterium]
MKRKLNLVLRDPVKLHKTSQDVAELPSPFDKKEVESKIGSDLTTEKPISKNPAIKEKKNLQAKPKKQSDEEFKKEIEDVRKTMSLRIMQVWEYFCKKANADNELKNSFTVTRAEVMREAGIGSTNTYRDALKRMQSLGLIRIELRPGVNAGSVFYLTGEGLAQAELVLEKNKQ